MDDEQDAETSQCSGESRFLVGTSQVLPVNLGPISMYLVKAENRKWQKNIFLLFVHFLIFSELFPFKMLL